MNPVIAKNEVLLSDNSDSNVGGGVSSNPWRKAVTHYKMFAFGTALLVF